MNDPRTEEEIRRYLKGLKPGELVIETGDCGMKGLHGIVYLSDKHGVTYAATCVRWIMPDGQIVGTSATWGTRSVGAVRSWPLGANPAMDAHAASNGLAHWSCTDPCSNAYWLRRDGKVHHCFYADGQDRTYIDELKGIDREQPMVECVFARNQIDT